MTHHLIDVMNDLGSFETENARLLKINGPIARRMNEEAANDRICSGCNHLVGKCRCDMEDAR
jgi:hypothetical protein